MIVTYLKLMNSILFVERFQSLNPNATVESCYTYQISLLKINTRRIEKILNDEVLTNDLNEDQIFQLMANTLTNT